MQSSSEKRQDVRAPLATFDTVDLGEEFQSVVTADDSVSSAEIDRNVPNINYKLDFLHAGDSENTIDECDASFSFPVTSTIKRLMHTNYQELPNENNKNSKSCDNDSGSVNLSTEDSSHFSSDSDTDSSDSESGYVRSGYIVVKGSKISKSEFPVQCQPFQAHSSVYRDDDSSFDNTPVSSPILPRASISTLLGELQHEKVQSKRKALEKRIERLQVTTKPVERPRSTTPINVHTFDEYVEFSSPEKSPFVENNEKLKIKLPGEEFNPKLKSPWKSRSINRDVNCVFSFNEEQLFTRTKSALVVQNDGTPGPSPKRVLIPPSLSPALSPSNSPKSATQTPSRTVYIPTGQIPLNTAKAFSKPETKIPDDNWVAFGKDPGNNKSEKWFDNDKYDKNTRIALKCDSTKQIFPNDLNDKKEDIEKDAALSYTPKTNQGSNKTMFGNTIDFEKIFEEEFLTVEIEEVDGNKICDVKCEPAHGDMADGYEVSEKLKDKSHTNTKTKESSDVELYSMKFDLIEEIEKEIQSRSEKKTENNSDEHIKLSGTDDLPLASNTP